MNVGTADEMRSAVRSLEPDVVPVAAGGDGTVNSLVCALRYAGYDRRPVAYIPLGTGNTFGYSIGIDGLPAAAAAITRGVCTAVDVMVTTDADFPVALVSLSSGFESRTLGDLAGHRGWSRHARAPFAVARNVARRTTGIELKLDGRLVVRENRRIFNVGLYNTPYYGRGRVVFPEADHADGISEAVVCENARAYLRTLMACARFDTAPTGSHRSVAGVSAYRWTTARLRSRDGVQIDGEAIDRADFEVTVEAKALQVLVPEQPTNAPPPSSSGG
jgi:diacylglycerol kinase family enzyme